MPDDERVTSEFGQWLLDGTAVAAAVEEVVHSEMILCTDAMTEDNVITEVEVAHSELTADDECMAMPQFCRWLLAANRDSPTSTAASDTDTAVERTSTLLSACTEWLSTLLVTVRSDDNSLHTATEEEEFDGIVKGAAAGGDVLLGRLQVPGFHSA